MISSVHEELVDKMSKCIKLRYAHLQPRLVVDRVGPLGEQKPSPISGYVPDIFCSFSKSDLVILGDAKTPSDLDNSHTKLQFDSFIRYLSMKPSGLLIICTLWPSTNMAKSILRQIRARSGAERVQIEVLNDITCGDFH